MSTPVIQFLDARSLRPIPLERPGSLNPQNIKQEAAFLAIAHTFARGYRIRAKVETKRRVG